jgi:hypothetical protein
MCIVAYPVKVVASGRYRISTIRDQPEKGTDCGILGELTALQKRARVKVTLNTRIDDWIDQAINKALRDLEESGVTNVTKEAIVIQSLIRASN